MALDPDILERIRSNDPNCRGLQFKNHQLDSNDVCELAAALKSNTVVVKLDLENTTVEDAGACALAEMFKKNTALATLDLRNTHIGDDGAFALAEAFKNNATLNELDFSRNIITDKGTQALVDALSKSKNILYVWPTPDALRMHCQENEANARKFIEKIENDPKGLTPNEREDIRDRIPAIIHLMRSNMVREVCLRMLVGIGIEPKPVIGPATNAVREMQRQRALNEPDQGI